MPGDPRQADAPGLQLEEERDVVGGQTSPCKHFNGEEVGPRQHSQMGGNKFLPGGPLAPLWCRGDTIPPEHVRHRLIRHLLAEVGQGSHDSIVPPAGVLSGHPSDQGLGFAVDGRSARVGSALGSVELAGNQPAVPGQNRVWLGVQPASDF
jgi:hypothetical protein